MEIKTIQLCKKIGSKEILKEINIIFEEGSTNIIVGPNGAGKTSLLRQISLLDKPSYGEIFYDGLAISKMNNETRTNLRRKIGFVFQNPIMLTGTVYTNLIYGLKLRKQKVVRNECEKVLDLVGLLSKKEQDAKTLSGGEKQRLSLARVFILKPDLYIFDELSNNLDPVKGRTIEDMIGEFINLKKTIVFATHNLAQARKFGENIFFMNNGKITQQGTADTIFSKPIDLTIAEYTFYENILHGKIIEEHGQKYFLSNEVKITVVAENLEGEVIAVLRAEDIFVSKTILESSARNSFYGTIKKIKNIGSVYNLTVNVKSLDFETVITKQSLYTMNLKEKDDVYITFKATSVHLIENGDAHQ